MRNTRRLSVVAGSALGATAALLLSPGPLFGDISSRLAIGSLTSGSTTRYQESFYENQPLSVRGQRFETMTVATGGPTSSRITLDSDGSTNTYKGHIAKDGTITLGDKRACGALDGYNFVASVIHAGPTFIDERTTWKALVPVEFATTCSVMSVPVTVTVENADGDVILLSASGRVVTKIHYEGSPSFESIDLHLHMLFIRGHFVQFDGTADNVLDSVKGHSAWTLAVEPSPAS